MDETPLTPLPEEVPERPGPPAGCLIAVGVVAAVVIGLTASWAYGRAGGCVPWWCGGLGDRWQRPLAPSCVEERALRTLRLAGFEYAVVGSRWRTVVVRVQLPEVREAGDVERAWQTAAAAAVRSYWYAGDVVVQLFDAQASLLQARFRASDVRDAVKADDGERLRLDGSFAYLVRPHVRPVVLSAEDTASDAVTAKRLRGAAPFDAVSLPERGYVMGLDLTGHYLDEKDRAAGLLGDAGPTGAAAERLAEAWRPRRVQRSGAKAEMRELVDRLHNGATPGAAAIAEDVRQASAVPQAGGTAARVRLWLDVVRAVQGASDSPSVLRDTDAVARRVREARVPKRGRAAGAVLAAARDRKAPAYMSRVRSFQMRSGRNTDGRPGEHGFPNRIIAAAGNRTPDGLGTLRYVSGGSAFVVGPETWFAYERVDERFWWVAGEHGRVALTDGSVLGWAWSRPRALLVDADDVGRVLAVYHLE